MDINELTEKIKQSLDIFIGKYTVDAYTIDEITKVIKTTLDLLNHTDCTVVKVERNNVFKDQIDVHFTIPTHCMITI